MRYSALVLAVLFGICGLVGLAEQLTGSMIFSALTFGVMDFRVVWFVLLLLAWIYVPLQLLLLGFLATWTSQFSRRLQLPKWRIYLDFIVPGLNFFAPTVHFANLGMGRRQLRKSTLAVWLGLVSAAVIIGAIPRLASTLLGFSAIAVVGLVSYSLGLGFLHQAFLAPLQKASGPRRAVVLPYSPCEIDEEE